MEHSMSKQFFDHSYGLDHIKLDLSGPKGNVFYVLSAIENLVKQVEGWEAAKGFAEMAMGTAVNKLGFNNHNDYNTILRYCKEKTGITFVANNKMGELDDDLYEVKKRTDDVWL
jgi:hypothetical protein